MIFFFWPSLEGLTEASAFVSKDVFFFLSFFIAVTGSCFFIFSSALKASAGYLAKSSIVEGRTSNQRGVTITLTFSCVLAGNSLFTFMLSSACQPKNCFIQIVLICVCCVSVYILTDCLCRRVYMSMHVSECVCVWPLVSVCVFLLYRCPLSPDGLMVQITVETMAELRRSLREMKDYTVTCGRLDQSDSQELVCVKWVEEKCSVNKGWVWPHVWSSSGWMKLLSSENNKQWSLKIICF